MTSSYDKGIIGILYTHLNKPELIDFGSGEKIQYHYDGSGSKLSKKVMRDDEILSSSLIYLGNFVYDWNGSMQYILTSEGRLVPDNKSYRIEYFMKDHLGNTRATYAYAAPGVPQVAEYQHYYPFGMQMEGLCQPILFDIANNQLYNGKELQADYNLQWYDYGARFYDPQFGRWHSVDPLAEKSRRWSPYNYCMDNPVRFIDPDGMQTDDPLKNNYIRAATSDNVSKNNSQFNDGVKNAVTVNVGTQAAGAGGGIKVGPVKLGGEISAVAVEGSSKGNVAGSLFQAAGSVAISEVGVSTNVNIGNVKVENGNVSTSAAEGSANVQVGNNVSIDNNNVSVSAKVAEVAITAGINISAVGNIIQATANAIKGFCQSLFTETTNNAFHTDTKTTTQEKFVMDKYNNQ